jgi:two-component system, cell cycle sensor histidine kinase and response regulator CckA
MGTKPTSAVKNPLKLLVADDEPSLRDLVKRFLDDPRFDVVEAGSGPEALAVVPDAREIDLLITDQMMPEMQGHELSRRLRLQNPDLRVLYLTGHSDALFDSKERLWDNEAYLDKPFTMKSLSEAIAMLMTGRLSF